ncbi:phosphomannomutase/phosphoglucomutase [Enemella sp. A6]|uniref:phosphomannomutase/phosphoglucomutase n=1 Tax=Enemella sp. A6 TaxID=3440152 RepID=UPI003EB6DB09
MINPGIFKANDIRGVVGDDWDADGAFAIGAAWADVLRGTESGDTIVVGRDMRTSSPMLAEAVISGARSRGANVIDIGLASTDQLWFASGHLDVPGVMLTASHNPGQYNGMKLCLAQAAPITPDLLAEVARRAMAGAGETVDRPGTLTETDVLPGYANRMLSLVPLDLRRQLRVVVDAGNGMAGHTLPAVFGGLDLDLIELYTDLDGTFPNHPPNPLDPENLRDCREAVRRHGADIGLVFDGDADRCFIIDEQGEAVDPSSITALIAVQELHREPGATIVCNTISSRSVHEVVEEMGGQIVVSRVGHTYVKTAMAEHRAIFGGEHSAHYYFRDFWGADTGMLAALHVIAMLAGRDEPLSQLFSRFRRYEPSGELNSTVADTDAAIEEVAERWRDRGTIDRSDGLTVNGDDWRFNLRASNTEPLLRLNVEAVEHNRMVEIRDEVLAIVRA